jgi:hypothetical protein
MQLGRQHAVERTLGWLSARNRQWNLTNYFEFLAWHRTQMPPDQLEKLNAWRGELGPQPRESKSKQDGPSQRKCTEIGQPKEGR